MPATSAFLRHVLPPAGALQSKLASYSSRLRSSLHPRQKQTSREHDRCKDRTDGRDGPYRNLKDRALAVGHNEWYDLEPYSAQAVKTSVVAEPFGSVSDDRIHLRIDLEQV